MDIASFIQAASLSTLILALALFVSKQRKSFNDFFFLGWMTIFCVHLITLNFFDDLPRWWFYVNEFLSYLHGLFLYIYVVLSFYNRSELKYLKFHIIIVFIIVVTLFVRTGEQYWEILPYVIGVKFLLIVVYEVLTLRELRINDRSMKNKWLYILCIGILILIFIPVLNFAYNLDDFLASKNLVGNLSFCLFNIFLVFVGIRRSKVFLDPELVYQDQEALDDQRPKYEGSSLGQDERKVLFSKLEKLMDDHELFLDPNLNINIIGEKLQSSIHQVSESINAEAQKNFRDYINQKRLQAFMFKVERKEHLNKTILALALDVGFNSKTSFNRFFSKQTGSTPSRWIRSKT